MALLIGIGSALAAGAFARIVGLDRDRAFYPTVMIVIALLYTLFSSIAGGEALGVELLIGSGFIALSVAGFKWSPWWVVVALVGHGLFDLVHPHVIKNSGVPVFWPDFCMAYDVTAGALLGWMVIRSRTAAKPAAV